MTARNWLWFVRWQAAWMVATVFGLVLIGAHSTELFVLVSILGLLVGYDLSAPVAVRPRWRDRARVLVALGLVGFALLVVRRGLELWAGGAG